MTPPAFLTGLEPFPDLGGWRADAALCARQNLKLKEMAGPECQRVITMLNNLDITTWISTLLSPEVFGFIINEPPQWNWAILAEALRETTRGRGPDAPPVWDSPAAEFKVILRNQGEGSRHASCANANFINSASKAFKHGQESIRHAMHLIREMTPGFAADIDAVVDRIALVDSSASFRGASGLGFRGMVMLSPDLTWTVGVYAEEIVHEATHSLLDLISVREPLLTGLDAFEPRWDAPFRPDKRPLYGNFHAVVVVARLIHLFTGLMDSGADPEVDWIARAADYARRSVSALKPLLTYPAMSPMARTLLEALVEPTIRDALAAPVRN